MSKTPSDETQNSSNELLPEYHFDYKRAKPNRFATRFAAGCDRQPLTVVVLDDDVAQVFTTPESVNRALRALIEAMP